MVESINPMIMALDSRVELWDLNPLIVAIARLPSSNFLIDDQVVSQ